MIEFLFIGICVLSTGMDTTSKSKFLKLLKKGTQEEAVEEKAEEEGEEEIPQRKKKYRKTRADMAVTDEN